MRNEDGWTHKGEIRKIKYYKGLGVQNYGGDNRQALCKEFEILNVRG